jgi:hypothetical protein
MIVFSVLWFDILFANRTHPLLTRMDFSLLLIRERTCRV